LTTVKDLYGVRASYGDSIYRFEIEFRPVVGDIFFIDGMFGTYGLEVETIIYVANGIFHAYAERVDPVDDYPPYYGVRGNKGTLIAHTIDQIKDHLGKYQAED
jgi:hypothetical protein